MAGYYIKIIVDSRRLTKQFKMQYEKFFLYQENVHILETSYVNRLNHNEFQTQLQKLHRLGFKPPEPKAKVLSKFN